MLSIKIIPENTPKTPNSAGSSGAEMTPKHSKNQFQSSILAGTQGICQLLCRECGCPPSTDLKQKIEEILRAGEVIILSGMLWPNSEDSM